MLVSATTGRCILCLISSLLLVGDRGMALARELRPIVSPCRLQMTPQQVWVVNTKEVLSCIQHAVAFDVALPLPRLVLVASYLLPHEFAVGDEANETDTGSTTVENYSLHGKIERALWTGSSRLPLVVRYPVGTEIEGASSSVASVSLQHGIAVNSLDVATATQCQKHGKVWGVHTTRTPSSFHTIASDLCASLIEELRVGHPLNRVDSASSPGSSYPSSFPHQRKPPLLCSHVGQCREIHWEFPVDLDAAGLARRTFDHTVCRVDVEEPVSPKPGFFSFFTWGDGAVARAATDNPSEPHSTTPWSMSGVWLVPQPPPKAHTPANQTNGGAFDTTADDAATPRLVVNSARSLTGAWFFGDQGVYENEHVDVDGASAPDQAQSRDYSLAETLPGTVVLDPDGTRVTCQINGWLQVAPWRQESQWVVLDLQVVAKEVGLAKVAVHYYDRPPSGPLSFRTLMKYYLGSD